MRLIKTLDYKGDYWLGVYECETCHGHYFDRKANPLPAPQCGRTVEGLECALCDSGSPLSERYWMALCTVAWACQPHGDFVHTKRYGFPSFWYVYTDEHDIRSICIRFDYNGKSVEVGPRWIMTGEGTQADFEYLLDADSDEFDQRSLAQVAVNLCLHDLLGMDDGKEAE
ncbi:hypothetical protein [Bifidobacterium xylocopae]|uniref:Uncharacterized protein n=1 Tax=Bifidobacterium xylocopae TaxID=2493119 RepID=A0A366KE94_9BIFI|nr:hypothetical protein [Bifidobacterium xylocopae]RBQ00046.1 hypothetical protein CRD59_00865 [Bifidobacterium xylocopae]